jgi:anti-sigma regulatory factor (Ser/Thr protein kinase)
MTSYHDDLVLPGRPGDLALVIDLIEQACSRAGVDPAAWSDLQLATEEACANVIEHAYREAEGQFSAIFLALPVADTVIGTISIQNSKPDAFD